jgi:3-deoxy-7-phosphoheptulonate synthase
MHSLHRTDDLRIKWTRVVLPPVLLEEELPISDEAAETVFASRSQVSEILAGRDKRLLVIVGPCSIHDPDAAREYAAKLKPVAARLRDQLCIVMRVYFEKPRTTVGWKGLINDPHLDQTFQINDGLRIARHLLLDLAKMGVPAGTEFLDIISPQYFVDLVTWGAIGARTTESQVHRQLVSGLSCPVGFKNGTSGDVQIAIDAMLSAREEHTFLGGTKSGQTAIFATTGNPDCHLILRGGRKMTNYDAASVQAASEKLEQAGLPARVMIDCSHANSSKDYKRQPAVAREIGAQVRAGDGRIVGVMVESNLVAGAQKFIEGKTRVSDLVYGQSLTDACLGWPETVEILDDLAEAVAAARLNSRLIVKSQAANLAKSHRSES